MVSTGMQGGCVCKNACLLRVGTGNVEFAALAAPRPLGLTAANDWTREIETKGGPELRRLYTMLGAENKLTIKAFLQFGHNYNQVSREVMYTFMNEHLRLGHPTPIREQPFEPIPVDELSVFDAQHARPTDAVDAHQLREYLTKASDDQIAALRPTTPERLTAFRSVLGPALRAMTVTKLPSGRVQVLRNDRYQGDGFRTYRRLVTRPDAGEQVPVIGFVPDRFRGTVAVAVLDEGKAGLVRNGEPVR